MNKVKKEEVVERIVCDATDVNASEALVTRLAVNQRMENSALNLIVSYNVSLFFWLACVPASRFVSSGLVISTERLLSLPVPSSSIISSR